MVLAEAIPELTEALRLRAGSTLLDLACGRGAYGLLVAKQAGTLLIGVAYEEIRRILKPGGRVALTCWEPFDRADERLSPRLRRANLAAGLRQAGFMDVEVRDRPPWLAHEHALWEEAAALDPGDDPALRSLHEEAVRSLQWTALLRRVLAVATNPL